VLLEILELRDVALAAFLFALLWCGHTS
jgi:hypothetical protein